MSLISITATVSNTNIDTMKEQKICRHHLITSTLRSRVYRFGTSTMSISLLLTVPHSFHIRLQSSLSDCLQKESDPYSIATINEVTRYGQVNNAIDYMLAAQQSCSFPSVAAARIRTVGLSKMCVVKI